MTSLHSSEPAAHPSFPTVNGGADRPSLRVTTQVAEIAKTEAGIAIDPGKFDFFAQRLRRRMIALGIDTFDAYLSHVQESGHGQERRALVEALTTHTTSFFREGHHYEFLLREGFPALLDRSVGKSRPLLIWSAACSSGVELYSAMIAATEFQDRVGSTLRLEGVGTDVSRPILKRAEHAVYQANEITGLSDDRRRRFLMRSSSGQDQFRIVPELRRTVRWQQSNLTDISPTGPAVADVIFVRNVLIYFDRPTQERVAQTLISRLSPGGYLITGHAESFARVPEALTSCGASIYRKKD